MGLTPRLSALVFVLVIAGCGSPDRPTTVDVEALERAIRGVGPLPGAAAAARRP